MKYISAVPVLPQRPAAVVAVSAPGTDRRHVVALYAAFAAFAGLVAVTSGQPMQWMWGILAAGGYALAALTAALWRSRGRAAALVIALAGAVAAPLAWHATVGGRTSRIDDGSLQVVARSGSLLLRHGTPYLPADQISRVLDYNPYGPAMAIFGLPAAAGLHGAAGNPRLWMGITAAAVLAAAFRLVKPGTAVQSSAFVFGSPALAMPLTSGLTDLPALSLLILALACTTTPRLHQAAAMAVGAACAIKAIAWPALPILAALMARDGARAATRFVVTAGITAAALIVATAPASVTAPGALLQNTVLFPLGMTRYQTPADSPLPGHLLAATGPGGRWAAIGLLCAASLAIAASLVIQPPADTQAATRRLAVSLATLFCLAPATRWGYFAYPAALLGFAIMIRSQVGSWQRRPAVSPAITGELTGGRCRRNRPAAPGTAGNSGACESPVPTAPPAHADESISRSTPEAESVPG